MDLDAFGIYVHSRGPVTYCVKMGFLIPRGREIWGLNSRPKLEIAQTAILRCFTELFQSLLHAGGEKAKASSTLCLIYRRNSIMSYSCTLLKPFDGFRCHLAGTLVGFSDTLC